MKSIELSKKIGGKIEIRSKRKLTRKTLPVLYTPGVADVSKAIAKNKKLSFKYTIRKNTVAVISDGSAVLGLGNIGPEAALPVMEGKALPDYSKAVEIVTLAAQKELIVPAAMVIIMPILVGFLGAEPLGGFLGGVVASGLMLAIFMCHTGGAWDNAKKYIESGAFGGKGSDSHKAAVVGDTVGDPFKDTAGPSLNILIKLMSVISLVIAPLFG